MNAACCPLVVHLYSHFTGFISTGIILRASYYITSVSYTLSPAIKSHDCIERLHQFIELTSEIGQLRVYLFTPGDQLACH